MGLKKVLAIDKAKQNFIVQYIFIYPHLNVVVSSQRFSHRAGGWERMLEVRDPCSGLESDDLAEGVALGPRQSRHCTGRILGQHCQVVRCFVLHTGTPDLNLDVSSGADVLI